MRKKEKKGIGCGGIIIIIIGLAILAALIVLITDKDDNKNNSESSNNSYFADENITDSFDNSIISKSEYDIESKATDDKNDLKTGSDEEKDSKSEKTDLIRPEFKEAIDSYVEFFDEYAEFMKKYNNSNDAISMLNDYTDYMKKYSETMEKFSKLESEEMNDAETAYYIDASAKISKKLLEVSQSIS